MHSIFFPTKGADVSFTTLSLFFPKPSHTDPNTDKPIKKVAENE